MKLKKRSLSLFLVAAMFLTACSGQTKTTESTTEEKATTKAADSTKDTAAGDESKAEETKGEETKELYTVKVFSGTAVKVAKWSDTPVGQAVVDKFGFDLEFVPPPAGDNKEQLGLMLSAGNYPEIVVLEDQDTADKYIAAGALLALDPYLDQMPNFTKWYADSIPYWRQAAGDGNLYNWNRLIPQDQAVFPENNDMIVRTDLLEQQDWKHPVSADEWVAFLKEAKEQNPTTPDGEPTIGMVAPFGESWGMAGIAPILYEKGEGIQIANGSIFYDAKDDIFVDMFTHSDTKESFQFFNRLYQEGLLDEESFTDKNDQITAKLNSGRALSAWYTVWLANGANQALREKGWDEMQLITVPIQSNGQVERGEKNIIMTQLTRPFDTIAITKNAQYPERIVEVLDFFSTEEGQVLMQSGIEGIHYTLENGKRIATQVFIDNSINVEDYTVKEGFGLGSVFGSAASTSKEDAQPFSLGLTEAAIRGTRPERVNQAYEQLGWETPLDWWVENGSWETIGVASGVSIDPQSEEGTLEARLADFRVKNTALLIQAKNDAEFDSLYESFVEQYNAMDPQIVVDKYNEIYQQGLEDIKQYQK